MEKAILKVEGTERDLQGELRELKDNLDKAILMITQVGDQYFNNYDPEDIEDTWKIIWEYSKNGTYIDIANDYMKEAINILDDIKGEV